MNKYKHKIPRDDLKRFAKEIAKKLVASDYKAGRVKDPTKIDERQAKKVKDFCKQFFEKAYQKHKKHESDKSSRENGMDSKGETLAASPAAAAPAPELDEDIKMSDNELDDTPSVNTPSDANGLGTLKRKRGDPTNVDTIGDDDEREPTGSPVKRLNMEIGTPPPPPPPPAPPVETPPSSTPREDDDVEMDTDIHADTNFKGRSMADVLAQAQAEDADCDEVGDAGDVVMHNGSVLEGQQTRNPMVDDQFGDEQSRGR
jgi:[histone H3]-lysine36 N-trimethyltransferase